MALGILICLLLNVKTYYRWIKIWRQIIWDARHEVDVNGADPKAIPTLPT